MHIPFIKYAVLLFILLYAQTKVQGQSKDSIIIAGQVLDSATKVSLPYSKVQITEGSKTRLVFTDQSGRFNFKASYQAQISFLYLGYQTKQYTGLIKSHEMMVKLSQTAQQLKDVNIKSKRALVKQEVDKIIYDVQSDPQKGLLNGLEALHRAPLVSLGPNDQVELNGKSDLTILINGRRNSMASNDAAGFLRALNASQIKQIELITQPGAKYDAEGTGGIINIIMAKETQMGYTGSISGRIFSPLVAGTNANLSLKTGKIGVTLYLNDTYQKSPLIDNQITRNVYDNSQSLIQTGQSKRRSNSLYGGTDISYEIDTLNLFTVGFLSNRAKNKSDIFQQSSLSGPSGLQNYTAASHGTIQNSGSNLTISYQNEGKKDKGNLLAVGYQYNESTIDQNDSLRINGRISNDPEKIQQNNYAQTQEHSAQVDYTTKIFSSNILEFGSKMVLRDNSSDSKYLYSTANTNHVSSTQSDLRYFQDVYSAYASTNYTYKKFSLKAGIRVERTAIGSNSGVLPEFKTTYTNYVPSVILQRKTANDNRFTLGYSVRIERPSIYQLNTFVNQLNQEYIMTGNPNLVPVSFNTVELNYSSFKDWSFRAGYTGTFANNTIEDILFINDAGKTQSSYANIGARSENGVNLYLSHSFFENLDLSLNSRLKNIHVSGILEGVSIKNSGLEFAAFLDGSLRLENSWRLNLYLQFNGPRIYLQQNSNWFYANSMGISKSFINRKINTSVSILNLFPKNQVFDRVTMGNGFIQRSIQTQLYRQFTFRISYEFGRLKDPIKKNSKNIENSDLKSQ
jgi:ferric enterobactin receptor